MQVALATDGKNLSDVLAKVGQARPAAVLLATAGAAVGRTGARAQQTNNPGVLMAGLGVTLTSEGLKQLGDAGSGLALTMVMPIPLAPRQPWCVTTRPPCGRARSSTWVRESYTNTRVLAEGLERAGADPTCSKLRTALAGIRNLDWVDW